MCGGMEKRTTGVGTFEKVLPTLEMLGTFSYFIDFKINSGW